MGDDAAARRARQQERLRFWQRQHLYGLEMRTIGSVADLEDALGSAAVAALSPEERRALEDLLEGRGASPAAAGGEAGTFIVVYGGLGDGDHGDGGDDGAG